MKKLLLVIFIVLPCIMASAQDHLIRISAKDEALSDVLREISDQSEYEFFYVDGLLADCRVTAEMESDDINVIMTGLLKNTGLEYRISNSTVYLTKKEKEDDDMLEGVVRDKDGNALAGVIVQNRRSNEYVVTDSDGKYRIEAAAGDPLDFSMLGFDSLTVNAGKSGILDVAMQEKMTVLDDVVVIGYGTQKKSDLISSIAKVSVDAVSNYPVANIEYALQGKVPGVNITNTSGRPGAGVQIRIRGIGTVNDNTPLYIVDGMTVSDISYLNMSDVESIEILKDASSAAIYGSRAANGVVIVTTKKGSGQPENGNSIAGNIEFESYVGIANPVKQLVPASADEYLDMVGIAYGEDSNTYRLVKTEYDKGYNTNWWKEVNRKNALLQNYNLSFNGGGKAFTYLLSANYLNQEGIDRRASLERISVRINTDVKIKEWLKIGENFNIVRSYSENGADNGTQGFVMAALMADPLYPAVDPEKHDENPFNNYGTSSLTNIANPVAAQDRYLLNRHGNKQLKMVGNVYGEVSFLQNFKFRTDFGVELTNGLSDSFTPVYYLDVDDKNNQANAWCQFDKYFRWTWINTLSYAGQFGKHSLSALLGFQSEANGYQYLEGNKFNQPNNNMNFQWISGGVDGDRLTGSYSDDAMLSYFARLSYSYDDRYLFSATFRADGSSKFGPGNRWGYFPSFALGWKINEERFFKNLHAEQVDLIKFRIGWGQLGNNKISSGAYDTFINGRVDTRFFFNGEEHVQGYSPSNAGNPDVSWERTETVNVGLDLAFFRSRLSMTFDWFNKDTKGMLLQVPIPDIFATYSPWENVGKVNNRGFEFAVDWKDDYRGFRYSAGFNISHYRNRVVEMGGTKPYVDSYSGISGVSGYCRTQENMPIGYFYGYKTDGIFQSPRQVAAYVNKDGELLQPNALMGDFRFVDANGDGKIDDNDKVMIGSPHPDFYYGFYFSVAYFGFDLQASFYGTYGNEIFNVFKYYTHRPVGFANVASGVVDKCWTVGSGIEDQPRITLEDRNNNYRPSDYYVEDGSYLRLKNLQIGYTVPAKCLEKARIKNIRVYLSGQNLFTITKYSGLDPEIGTGSDRVAGVDAGNYPQTRVYQVGLNFTF